MKRSTSRIEEAVGADEARLLTLDERSKRARRTGEDATAGVEISARGNGPDRIRTVQLGKSWFGPTTGGLARVYEGLVRHLPGAGVDVDGVIIADGPPSLHNGLPVRRIASVNDPLYRRCLGIRRLFRDTLDLRDYDLAASHFALYTLPVIDRLKALPLVVHFHGPWAHESAAEGQHGVKIRLKKGVEELVYRRAARFIVLSEAFRDVLTTEYEIPEGLIHIVPGGVDVARFDVKDTKREARERLVWPLDRPIVLAVRRLVRRMGLENLIAAIDGVRRRIPDVMLIIAGRGHLFGELEARISEAGLRNHVRLLGFIPDMDLALAYRAADVTVVPTVALEGFGLVTIESLAAGTPVLVTPAGGLPEVVRDLSHDLIMTDGRADTMRAHLTDALTGTLRLPSDELCRSFARARYDWASVARQVRAVYEEVLR